MIDQGKKNVLGVEVDAVDYEARSRESSRPPRSRKPYSCTALAVHGVMTGVLDPEQRYRLNRLDLVTPDGQPVRWGLNALHGTGLPDRVYGPTLTLHICEAAAREGLSIYLFGSRPATVQRLSEELTSRFPGLEVAGAESSSFRQLTSAEHQALIERIRSLGAAIAFVGLGCPRQEIFAYECAGALSMPVLAVGAAFDYHAGEQIEPPMWVQRLGLQWVHRLIQDPRRLWKRYLGLNSLYVALLALQLLRLWRPTGTGKPPRERHLYG